MVDAVAVRAQNLTITQPGARTPVLSGVDLSIREGDLSLVVGRTGVGKSTLLGTINGLVPHTTGATMGGHLTVAGHDTRECRPRDLAHLVGHVGQNPAATFVADVVEDEVAYGMEQLGLAPSVMRKRVEETLDLMGIASLRRRRVTELSGGQQQRVAIAAVLAAGPRVLVLDEPTSALDPTAAQDVLAAITSLVHDVGLTVVLAEHRLERVMQAADSVLWLPGDGSVVAGAPAQVLGVADVTPPLVELSRHLGWAEVPLSVREARRRIAVEGPHLDLPQAPELTEAVTDMVDDPMARLRRVGVRYGDVQAVRSVDLDLAAGSSVALMGRNGSGKSSLLWALQGAVPSTGSVEVGGEDPRRASDARARELVSLVPQSPADLLYLPTVDAECQQADRESDANPGTTAALVRRLGGDLPGDRNPRDLSEGQRLTLVLAIQLAASPAVICLDEPTRGLDYAAKDELRQIVTELTAQGVCVVIATHDVEFAAAATRRTVVLAEGDVIADGPTRVICSSSPAQAPQLAKVFRPADVVGIADLGVPVGRADPGVVDGADLGVPMADRAEAPHT